MSYEVRLQVFEGPLDLLLHLITRKRVDIYEVSIATITEEYLAAVASADELDLESSTGFLVVAASLLELKAARLLPSNAQDPEAGDLLEERDLLLARLVECATFREAGAWILVRMELGMAYHARRAPLEDQFVVAAPDLLAGTTVIDVAHAAAAALAPKPSVEVDTSHLQPIRASVREAIADIATRLGARKQMSFEALCDIHLERIEIVVRFLALLELLKAGALELGQTERFGTITASWTGEVGVDEVLADVEEYAGDREVRA
ncbi:MAG: segregation/condensation protein A [Actinobacteria bacterium]|nr:segregation/condensation protein A [Actinomycetota bacterium]